MAVKITLLGGKEGEMEKIHDGFNALFVFTASAFAQTSTVKVAA